jgi:hypothetical protein
MSFFGPIGRRNSRNPKSATLDCSSTKWYINSPNKAGRIGMDQGTIINLAFLGIVVLLVIIGIVMLVTIKSATPSSDVVFGGPFELKEHSSAVKASDFGTPAKASSFLKSGDGTFQAFVYLDTMAKTGEYVPCGSSPAEPTCDTGAYRACRCEAIATCNTCIHKGYKTIFSLYGVYTFEVLNVPDASRPNAVSAQVSVLTTQNTASGRELYKETISLPALPLQKWVMITLVHEGRRVDVYYNDSLVGSAKLENVISTENFNLTHVDVGDAGLTGVIGLLRFYGHAVTGGDVRGQYKTQVDTRGAPVEIDTQKAQYSTAISKSQAGSMLSRLCLDGSCFSGGIFRPPNVTFQVAPEGPAQVGTISSLYALDSPYA